MANTQIGYSLINLSSNTAIQSWDDPPSYLYIPSDGSQIHAPKIGDTYSGYRVVERWLIDNSPGPLYVDSGRAYSYDGNTYNLVVSYQIMTVAIRKTNMIENVNEIMIVRMRGGIAFANTIYSTDEDSQTLMARNLQNATLAVMDGTGVSGNNYWSDDLDANNNPTVFQWIATDDTAVTMDAPTFIEFSKSVIRMRKRLIYYARQLKLLILAATTHAQLNAIDIQTGWPTFK